MLKLYRQLFHGVEYETYSEDDSYTKIIEINDNKADSEHDISKDEHVSRRNNQDSTSSNFTVAVTDVSVEVETMRRDEFYSNSLGSTPEDMMYSKESLTPVIKMDNEMLLTEKITQFDESITVPVRDTGTALESNKTQEMTINTSLQHSENSEKSNSCPFKCGSSHS
ncbi:unnamed protein product [Parnassius apollo]|uniref:(apollo) hypothetical protein n=1 Tax=Parnassius apollo TaxID=110799 RepID=A0A8S3Y5A1_PARAO|nr:unnamed protein product [Parnassius apollo]